MTISPNCAPRAPGSVVSAVVLHYTGMKSANEARARLCDPEAEVSAHYLVLEDGATECLVDENNVAWHAGVSAWRGMVGLNRHSIGIEIVNPGHEWGYRPFPQAQIDAVCSRLADIVERYRIPAVNILAHSDIAPGRKDDPGELFPWPLLAWRGLGVWPKAVGALDLSDGDAERMLTTIGYRVEQPATTWCDVVRAFQRRYRPGLIDGRLDSETKSLIAGLAGQLDKR